MMRASRGAALLLALAVLSAAPQASAQRGNPETIFAGQSIDGMIAEFMAEHDVPGMALAIVQAPYIPRVTGYGLADTQKRLLVGSHTLFDIGDMADAYTAVAVMQLVETKGLRLDDAVGKHLHDLPPAWSQVAVLDLLRHSSGIPDYRRAPQDRRTAEPAADPLALAAVLPPAFEPGREIAYSATNYRLLARLVQAVAGEPYRDFVRRNQFERLGLRHTMFAADRAQLRSEAVELSENLHKQFLTDPAFINPSEVATGYRSDDAAVRPSPASAEGADAILSTAMDISIWDIGLAGEILVKDAALRALLYRPARLGQDVAPAMGPWRFPGRPGLMYVTGSSPGFSAFLSRFTAAGELVCVTLLANREGVDLSQLARRIAGAYDARLGPPEAADMAGVQQSPYSVWETAQRLERSLRAQSARIVARRSIPAPSGAKGTRAMELSFAPPRFTPVRRSSEGRQSDPPLVGRVWAQDGQVWVGYGASDGGPDAPDDRNALSAAMRRQMDGVLLRAVTPY